MPMYSVWYRDIPEPLEFVTITRSTDMQIVARILDQEKIAAPVSGGATVQDLIAANKLAPVRYTEDESEMNFIR
jgi:hypothetical protein